MNNIKFYNHHVPLLRPNGRHERERERGKILLSCAAAVAAEKSKPQTQFKYLHPRA
jgi:hypothetical protein